MKIYVAADVADVEALHHYLYEDAFRALPIRNQIEMQARTIEVAHAEGDRRIRMHVLSWWPGAHGLSLDDVMSCDFTSADALHTMSREYGFGNWNEVDALGETSSPLLFEQALDDLLRGDVEQLRSRLEAQPMLATARSAYGHQSSLLHYLGANGVESHRQRTPLNAVELAGLLVEFGADIEAKANMYGGGQTAFDLASTSAHPRDAGIAIDLNRFLKNAKA